jgi:hypothetical protein
MDFPRCFLKRPEILFRIPEDKSGGHIDYVKDASVRHLKIDSQSFLPGTEHSCLDQNFEMAREIRLFQAKCGSELTIAADGLADEFNDADPVGMRKGGE